MSPPVRYAFCGGVIALGVYLVLNDHVTIGGWMIFLAIIGAL